MWNLPNQCLSYRQVDSSPLGHWGSPDPTLITSSASSSYKQGLTQLHQGQDFNVSFGRMQFNSQQTLKKTNKPTTRASLVVQWLKILLAMQRLWFDLWSGNILQAVGQLKPCTTAMEPRLWSLWSASAEPTGSRVYSLKQEKPPQREASAAAVESSPCLSQGGKVWAQQKQPSTAKINE